MELAIGRGSMDVDGESLPEAKLQVSYAVRLRGNNTGAQAGKPQQCRIEFAIIAVRVVDFGYISSGPTHCRVSGSHFYLIGDGGAVSVCVSPCPTSNIRC